MRIRMLGYSGSQAPQGAALRKGARSEALQSDDGAVERLRWSRLVQALVKALRPCWRHWSQVRPAGSPPATQEPR